MKFAEVLWVPTIQVARLGAADWYTKVCPLHMATAGSWLD